MWKPVLPEATPERAKWTGIALLAILSFAVGVLMAFPFRPMPEDDGSYVGGISYVVVRQRPYSDGVVTISPYTACTMYVDAGMNDLDGYHSDSEFLRGCQDAVRYLDRENAPEGT